MIIKIRDFNGETDTGFIVDSMPKDIYFDKKESRRGRINKKWFEEFHQYLMQTLLDGVVFIAAADEDPQFILGYAIFLNDQLQFIHVKEAYRKQGIATLLANSYPYTNVNEKNLTKLGRKILEQNSAQTEPTLTNQEYADQTEGKELKESKPDSLAGLISIGIPIIKATFQSAILSGFNAAEFQLDVHSKNTTRVPDSMHYTPHGLIVKQNHHRFIIPLSNIIQCDIEKPAAKDLVRER